MPVLSDAFRRLVSTRGYPCVMATSVLRRGQFTPKTYGPLGSAAAADGLTGDLAAFARAPEPERGYRSFLAVFRGAAPATEKSFENALWTTLRALHARDEDPWDPAVASDPRDPAFSFSFAGRAFYVVGLHPHASRPARRCARPALVFNLHEQFEQLRREGRYDKVRSLIRDRDRAFAGSVNPMMENFGERSEARQYAGRAVDDDWQCPFHSRR